MYSVKWRDHVEKWLNSSLPHNASILVVKYENLLTDLRRELIRMMKYLEYPYTEEDLDCTIKSNTGGFRRKHLKYIEHYTQGEIDAIYKQIILANKVLKKYNISYEKHILQT